MAAMEGLVGGPQDQPQQTQQQQQQQPPPRAVERLNSAVQQQLNLDSIKTRAFSLSKAISRILEDFDAMSRSNIVPKWQESLNQFSMVNLELYNIVEDIKKVSKAFVVQPKNVNAENATILPVMLSSKLLPEMEVDENSKRDQLLHGLQNLPVPQQIDKLKARIDMIAAACESAEKVIADTRKTYGLDTRHRLTAVPTLDKAQTAKIQEQESLLRVAVNHGEGLRLPPDQKQIASAVPMHLADILTGGDAVQTYGDGSGMYSKNTPPMSMGNINNQGTPLQVSASQLHGRSVPSPSGASGAASVDNTASPLPYSNSPRSGTSIMNAPSPQQQQLLLQRQKLIPLSQQQQLLAQQQFRQSSMPGLGQNQLPQLHDLQSQAHQKFQSLQGQHQMQFSQSLASQPFQGRQLSSGHVQHSIGQSQLNQGSQLNRHIGQFSGPANSALFNAAQTAPNAPMISNMSATMASQSVLPRMQFALPGGNQQRSHAAPILTDQIFNMGPSNSSNMMPLQSQQQGSQGSLGNMQQSAQNLQPNMLGLQNVSQSHPNFQQQRQMNQQQ